jgi:hypothetical protein
VSTLDDLADALHGIPPLPGSRCRNQAELFDEYDDPATVEHAISVCQQCPVLSRCREYVESLPARHRPAGVTAGVCRKPRQPRKRKRDSMTMPAAATDHACQQRTLEPPANNPTTPGAPKKVSEPS